MTQPATTTQTWPPDNFTGPAVWRIDDTDQPVTVTGCYGKMDGERYFAIEGSGTGIPAGQLRPVPPVYDMAETARWYAQSGWQIFPCEAMGKEPLTPHGYKDATTDLATIAAWWQKWPDANIGLACGPSGLIALDGDPAHYNDESREFLAHLLAYHPTAGQSTPAYGTHLLYKLPPDVSLTNSPRGLPPGIDVRVGGYVLLAPSLVEYHGDEARKKNVPDGHTGRYAWLPGCGPHERLPQPLPEHVLNLLRPPQRQTPICTNGHGTPRPGYGAVALDKELDTLARTPDGSRNNQLNTAAFNLGQLVAGGELDEREVRDKLSDVALAVGLSETETRKAISSGLAAGKKQPRSAPPKTPLGFDAADMAALGGTPPVYTNGAAADPDEPAEPHPLDTTPARDLQLGWWLDAYTDLMTYLTGSPAEFNRLAGLLAAATVIQRKACLPMFYGRIYPNLYGCIVAPTTVYHKTSSMGKVRQLLRRAMMDDLLLSELQTAEGLLSELQSRQSGIILRDEIGALFDSGNVKYLRNLKPDLTALYDCAPYRRRLSALEIKVDKPYLNILGATTPERFYDGVGQMDWADGFLVRWLFVLPEEEPNFDAMTGLLQASHDQRLGELAAHLHNLGRQHDTDFVFTGNAHSLWDSWQRRAVKDAYHYGDNLAVAICARYATYALKFAMILAALNDEWGSVTPDTMQTAIALADSFKRHIYRLRIERGEYEVSGGKLQKVFAVIKSEGQKAGGWVTTRVIQAASHLRKEQLDPCLEKLVEVGAVVQEPTKRGYKYAVTTDTLPVKSWR